MHVRRALALTLAVPLLLSGCSEDEPTPKIPDPTTSSPTPTPDETETPEAESAEDFIRRWATVESEMENTGETSEYRSLSDGCRACADLADLVEKYYAAGGYVEWSGWDIRSIKPRGNSDLVYVVKVQSAPTRYAEKAGGKEKGFEGGPGEHLITLEAVGASWVVADKSEVG